MLSEYVAGYVLPRYLNLTHEWEREQKFLSRRDQVQILLQVNVSNVNVFVFLSGFQCMIRTKTA